MLISFRIDWFDLLSVKRVSLDSDAIALRIMKEAFTFWFSVSFLSYISVSVTLWQSTSGSA